MLKAFLSQSGDQIYLKISDAKTTHLEGVSSLKIVKKSLLKRLRVMLVATSLLLLSLVGLTPPAFASAPVLLYGNQWLSGQGVNVCSGSTDPYCGSEYKVGGYSANWWQCVELAQRLYQKMGWHSGSFGVSYAYQIYDVANSIGMSRQANGSITSIVPGDMIIHNSSEPYSGGAGHVSIVDTVNGGTVNVVEQNTYNNQPRGSYSLSGGVLSRPGSTIRGVVHDPANTNSSSPTPAPTSQLNLSFIKTANSNGKVEIHWSNASSNFSSWSGGVATWFSASDAANGQFVVYDMNGDSKKDLVFIKTKNTGGKVELHWLDAANNFSGVPYSVATWFSAADAVNGQFMMGSIDGHPDLVFVKTANTGGNKIELHYATSLNNYSSWAGGTATWFSLADASNGTFTMHNMDGVGGDDLVFIKTANTSNAKVELHWLSDGTGFTQVPASYSTWFNAADAANGKFSVSRLDGHPDLTFIKTANTGGSNVELHYASSANNYSSWAAGTATWFNISDAPNGSFMVGAK